MTGFGTYPVIHKKSNMWLQLGPLLQKCRHITRLIIQNAFYFMKDRCRNVHLSMGIILIMNKMRMVFKWTRIRDKQLRIIDRSGYNRKCAANWGVSVRERAERRRGLLAAERNHLEFPVRVNRPLLCQEDRWTKRVDCSSAPSELKEIRR